MPVFSHRTVGNYVLAVPVARRPPQECYTTGLALTTQPLAATTACDDTALLCCFSRHAYTQGFLKLGQFWVVLCCVVINAYCFLSFSFFSVFLFIFFIIYLCIFFLFSRFLFLLMSFYLFIFLFSVSLLIFYLFFFFKVFIQMGSCYWRKIEFPSQIEQQQFANTYTTAFNWLINPVVIFIRLESQLKL